MQKTPIDPAKVNGFFLAVGLFTLLPTRAVTSIDRPSARRSVLAFPWLGLCLGLVAGALAGCLAYRSGTLLGALVGVMFVEFTTGFMHLDGLADTADGLGARGKPTHDALAIMRKSDIGPMGVAAVVFILALQVVGLSALHDPYTLGCTFALACLIGRTTVVWSTKVRVPGIRSDGFGALFSGLTSPLAASIITFVALALCAATGWWLDGYFGGAALLASAIIALLLAAVWQKKLVSVFGGLSGDMMGSLIEIATATFILAVAILF